MLSSKFTLQSSQFGVCSSKFRIRSTVLRSLSQRDFVNPGVDRFGIYRATYRGYAQDRRNNFAIHGQDNRDVQIDNARWATIWTSRLLWPQVSAFYVQLAYFA